MKKVLFFIWVITMGAITQFYTKLVYAKDDIFSQSFQTLYGVTFTSVRPIAYSIGFLTTISLIISSIVTAIKRKGRVKITFTENGKEITKLCKIISMDKKKVIFEDKENQYECSPKEIIKIQKRNKSLIALIIVFISFILFGILDYVIAYMNEPVYSNMSEYGVVFEDFDDSEFR